MFFQRTQDDFPQCNCRRRRCTCAGGIHAFRVPYSAVLAVTLPQEVVEWGPGLNTELALQLPDCRVFAIESVVRWVPTPRDARFACLVCHEQSAAYTSLHGRNDADVVFVDGRRRSECIERVWQDLKPTGIVCVHDAQRARYQSAIGQFPCVAFFGRGFAAASRSPLPLDQLNQHVLTQTRSNDANA